MSTQHTLMIVPILNNPQTNRFFIENAYEFWASHYDADIIIILKGVTQDTIKLCKTLFGIPSAIRVNNTLRWFGRVGIISEYDSRVCVSKILNTVFQEAAIIYENVILSDPNTVLLPEIGHIFALAGDRAGWSSVAFPSKEYPGSRFPNVNDVNFLLTLNIRDLGGSIDDVLMVFPDRMYKFEEYRVIVCKGHIFNYLLLHPDSNTGFATEISKKVSINDEGVAMYVHKLGTLYLGN